MTKDFSLEDPDLDAAHAVCGVRFGFGVIDVGAQRMKRHAAFAILFGPRDFRAAEATAAHDLDAFGAEPHGRLHRALHRAAERDAAFELVGDPLCDKLGVNLGLADFDDVERHVARRHRAERLAQLFDVGALLADDDTGARGIDRHAAKLGRTIDDDLADRRLGQLLDDVLADLEILHQQPTIVVAFGIPAAVPGTVDLQTQADRIGFMTHD